ncbi:MAG: serine/threonine protein kinase [Planctomycetes bacterium]|nr:serine/threonine protein kinase [Planctomycetota bacterium]
MADNNSPIRSETPPDADGADERHSVLRPNDSRPADSPQGESQFRLVTTDGAVVFPENLPPSDDQPTIISKSPPSSQAIKAAKAASPNLTSLRGRKLAHFELIEPIGVGGMAAVLRARDTQLDRNVALKILPPDVAKDPEIVRRFHQEARAAAKLDHENIARVFYCGEDQRLHFIAFEFVEGENLRTLLDRRGRIPVAEAVRYILQIASGLEHAASRGVVHRDVKPSNIIISPNGRAKLVDMGLARSLEPHKDDGVTQSGVTLGTFDYISPEQALEPREADARSDLYSLGCTFYHMLTGHTPAPDGTPAKKLHHHQHVAPVDPRQLNPEIPDDVVAILSRMMAKDPKDRYQRPVHLIQHLMQVAQKVGAAADVPEGVMFVDVPMPAAPRTRPLLVTAIAALALGSLLAVLSLAPSSQQPFRPSALTTDKPSIVKDSPNSGQPQIASQPAGNGRFQVRSEQDLAQALADTHDSILVTLKSSLDLSEGGLGFNGEGKRQLVIESADPREPKTIRFKYHSQEEITDSLVPGLIAGLTLDGGAVTFRNIRFEIVANETPNIAVASLGIKGHGTVRFEKCWFVQTDVPFWRFIDDRRKRLPIADICVDNPNGNAADRPRIVLDQCSFMGGQSAVTIHGTGDVQTTQCAFMPHGVLFHLRGDSGDHGVSLKLQHCSAFVVRGPAFRLDDTATCVLQVDNSIFSCPNNLTRTDDPHLIRQTDSADPAVRYAGSNNAYHALYALWAFPETRPNSISKLEEFQAEILNAGGRGDVGSQDLKTSPWVSADPLKQEPSVAFQVKTDMREVRTPDLKRSLGVEMCAWGPMAELPPLTVPDNAVVADGGYKLNPNEKIVDPEYDGVPGIKGVYKTIFQAIALANAGDVLLIKHGKTRDIEVQPMRLDKPNVDLTLRPYPGHAPILNVADTSEEDAALFRLQDGKLQFEKLEFVLEPDQLSFRAQAVVMIAGNASCSFKNCVVTMQPTEKVKHSRRIPLSAVTLTDPEDAMKMGTRNGRTVAEIKFEDCFVRGEGDLLSVRASRPLDLDIRNTLIGLAGSLLAVNGATKEAAAEALAAIKLTRVTAFITEPVHVLRAGKNVKGLVLTRVESARDCLFVSLLEKPLVHLEANENTEEAIRGYFDWKGGHNAFANFNIEKIIETRPEDSLSSTGMDAARWAEVFKEPDSKFLSAEFQMPLPLKRSLWLAHPEDFQPRSVSREALNSFGAILTPDSLPLLQPSKKIEAGRSEE